MVEGQGHQGGGPAHPGPTQFNIQIDRQHYVVTQSQTTGAQLRAVPSPAIGPDRDLFEVVPGDADRKIEESDTVEIRNGKRFFTAPSTINPGQQGAYNRVPPVC